MSRPAAACPLTRDNWQIVASFMELDGADGVSKLAAVSKQPLLHPSILPHVKRKVLGKVYSELEKAVSQHSPGKPHEWRSICQSLCNRPRESYQHKRRGRAFAQPREDDRLLIRRVKDLRDSLREGAEKRKSLLDEESYREWMREAMGM